MKSYIKTYLLLLALCLVGCRDDVLMPDTPEEGDQVYTLQVSIEDIEATRGLAEVNIPGLKTQWCYGDTVVLKNSANNKTYDFIIKIPNGQTKGDPTGSRNATFYCTTNSVDHASDFSGTLTYKAYNHKVKNGYLKQGSDPVSRYIDINVNQYEYQTANNSSDHLRYADKLSANLSHVNLTLSSTKIELKRQISVLKVVLDGFYYPIYYGSLLFVNGLGPFPMCLALGENTMLTEENKDDSTVLYNKLNNVKEEKTPEGLGIIPFCQVSENEDPITGYAKRDGLGAEKIVAYMVLNEECEIHTGDVITVGLREHWSRDWYFWKTEPLRAKKLPFGSVYTLDFTKQYGGKYQYEPVVGINTSIAGMSHFATKNLGAKSITDTGDYFLFGSRIPVHQGEHYAGYPESTPIYHFTPTSGDTGCQLGGGNVNPITGAEIAHYIPFLINPSTYGNGDIYIGSNTDHEITVPLYNDERHHPLDWWRIWANELTTMPTLYSQPWGPLGNYVYKRFNASFNATQIIEKDGNPVGILFTVKRSKHKIFLPVSGVLEPSEMDAHYPHQVPPSAVAQIRTGNGDDVADTSNYVVLAGYCFYLTPTSEGKSLKVAAYSFDAGNSDVPKSRESYDLNEALTIRPSFNEDLNPLHNFLNGNYFNCTIHQNNN